LRIGYISPDFRHHPVAFFLQPVFQHHNRQKFFIACYSAVEKRDATTAFFEQHSSLWRNIVGQTDQQVARQIDDDQIDILIDLAGHTDSNRLPVLAYKPTPIQITWLGYPNTTGMSRVDYRITDANADPLNSADPFYTEKLIRLPDSFFVYQPPSNAPEVIPAPVLANGHVTFGSFNNIAKLTPKMGELWSRILQALPNSRLLIAGAVYSAGDRLRAMITGVDPQRIMIAESTNFESYLRLFEQVDIALDSYPWAGHTTTCHALWMGVPVVSLAGPTAVSRAGVSVMTPLGLLNDWVAFTEADYIQLATRWAQRPAELNALRLGMRDRMRASTILNAERFTRQLEHQLEQLVTQRQSSLT
jgi:predicted O-linked N-acetylglucosamine transferase (SPINDLY family)